jgi:hypothetical protein
MSNATLSTLSWPWLIVLGSLGFWLLVVGFVLLVVGFVLLVVGFCFIFGVKLKVNDHMFKCKI